MKASFILILLAFFVSVAYVTWHLWRITPGGPAAKGIVAGLFLLWMVLAFAGIVLRKRVPYPLVVACYEVGMPWLVAYIYLLIAFVLADFAAICRLVPEGALSGNLRALLALAGALTLVLVAGNLHYRHKYREELTIRTEKPLERPLTLVLASDLHIGYSNRRPELARWIDLISAEHPDLVLFGGDIVDIRTEPLVEGAYAEEFCRLPCPVFAVPGNHEYIAGEAASERFLADAGITVLRDSVAHFAGLDIIGRDDGSNRARASVRSLAAGLGGFTLLLDHQPHHLEEAERAGIDFQFSGHTHRGQFWPVSWLTDVLFEKSWGHYRRGATRYYISSGLGIWGPKFRLGTRSEYLVLHLEPVPAERPGVENKVEETR